MKPLLFSSLLVLSSASVALAQCRNGWCQAACTDNGKCYYIKVTSIEHPFVTYLEKGPRFEWKIQADCQQYKTRYLNPDGTKDPWIQQMPGSVGEGIVETACNW